MTKWSAAIAGEDHFYPFGETRFTTGNMQTDKLFTGQRAMASLGIYHYNARFYSPKLGRFLSADTIVPNPADPQHLNRFSYVANNPLKYIDPSGHKLSAFDGGGGSYKPAPKKPVGDNYCASHPWTCVGSKPDKPKGGGGGSNVPVVSAGGSNGAAGKGGSPQSTGGGECGDGIYSPRCPGWHFYSTTNMVCPAELNCTAEEMKDQFKKHAYPGQNSSFPVVDGGQYSVSPCNEWICVPMGPAGAIRVDISDDGFTTVNQTLPSHILHDGKVIRHLYQGSDGAWYVGTYGYGNNTTTYISPPDAVPGPHSVVPISLAPINESAGPGLFDTLDQEMLANIEAHH